MQKKTVWATWEIPADKYSKTQKEKDFCPSDMEQIEGAKEKHWVM